MAQVIATTNVEKSAEVEVADSVSVNARTESCIYKKRKCNRTLSSQMSEEELSSCHDSAYPDNKEEVTIAIMLKHEGVNKARNRRMPNGTYGGERVGKHESRR